MMNICLWARIIGYTNAGKTEEKKRAIDGTIITTSSDSISYTKEELFS